MRFADFSYGGRNFTQELAAIGAEFIVSDIRGDGLLGADVSTLDSPGGDGSRMSETRLPERVIEVDYALVVEKMPGVTDVHSALEAKRRAERAMAGLLHRGSTPQQLTTTYEDGHFMAKSAGITSNNIGARLQKGTLTFVCPSPFLWGAHGDAVIDGGVAQIESNYFVEPQIIWTLDTSSGAPSVSVDGRTLMVDTPVNAGQQISIDATRKEVRVDGVLTVEHVRGQFPQVWDGSNFETVPGGNVSVSYQERWV